MLHLDSCHHSHLSAPFVPRVWSSRWRLRLCKHCRYVIMTVIYISFHAKKMLYSTGGFSPTCRYCAQHWTYGVRRRGLQALERRLHFCSSGGLPGSHPYRKKFGCCASPLLDRSPSASFGGAVYCEVLVCLPSRYILLVSQAFEVWCNFERGANFFAGHARFDPASILTATTGLAQYTKSSVCKQQG